MWVERARTVRAGTEAIADAVVGRWFTSAFAREHPETVALPGDAGRRPRARGTRARAMPSQPGTRERIAAVSAPTLVVAGAEDSATPVEHGELLASCVPEARLLVLDRAAHLANVEQAERFTVAVLAHLGQEVAAQWTKG